MRHFVFSEKTDQLAVALFVRRNAFKKAEIKRHYVDRCVLPNDRFVAIDLPEENGKPLSAKKIREWFSEVLAAFRQTGIRTLVVADSHHARLLAGEPVKSGRPHAVSTVIKNAGDFSLFVARNHKNIRFDPRVTKEIDKTMDRVARHIEGRLEETNRWIRGLYPETLAEIEQVLEFLATLPVLGLDIETRSLDFTIAGILSVAFATSPTTGAAFLVDRHPQKKAVRERLKQFFTHFSGTFILHNAKFDFKILVFELFMKDLGDEKGKIRGIEILTRRFEDSLLCAYLATNTTLGNRLSLKWLAEDAFGDWGIDVENAERLPAKELLSYNLTDAMAAWYVYDRYLPKVRAAKSEAFYETEMKATTRTFIQMELTGLPIDPERVAKLETELLAMEAGCRTFFAENPVICRHLARVGQMAPFNPGSAKQVAELVYGSFGATVVETTKKGAPSTKGKVLELLAETEQNPEQKRVLDTIRLAKDIRILLSTFIPAFQKAKRLPDGSYRLFGNYNSTGTQSLRASSSDPNLQNIPANSRFGERVKRCFKTPPGWVFMGADMDALEEKAGALVTKDPNRLSIYTRGFDGHSYRTYHYWPEKFPDIDPEDPASVNEIESRYPDERKKSKPATFALQYLATEHALMAMGFSAHDAKSLVARYHDLYRETFEWIDRHIERARKTGFVPLAFGARLYTPLLARATGKRLSGPVLAEKRSAANALVQSYCYLTLRALNAMRRRILAAGLEEQILISATIHDANYFIVKDDPEILEFTARLIIEEMAWQNLPELVHPEVSMSATPEIYHPDWGTAHKVHDPGVLAQILAQAKKA